MRISLPLLFEEKLEGRDQEKGIVYSSLSSFGKWFGLIESATMPRSEFPFAKVLTIKKSYNNKEDPSAIEFAAECRFTKPWHPTLSTDLIGRWWNHFFGEEWLPWKKADRKARFPKAYDELAPYFRHYE